MVKLYIFSEVKQHIQSKRSQLDRKCYTSIKQGNADGTRANRRTADRAYKRFCAELMFSPYPATSWRLVQFAQYLFDENKRPGTVANYVSAVRIIHRLAEMQCPDPDQIHYKLMLNGLKRQCKEPVKQAVPLNHNTLSRLFTQVNLNSELEAVAWTAVLLGHSLVLRVSNLGPTTRSKFDDTKHLLRSDFVIKDGYPSLGIRWSKTIQYKNKVNWAPILKLNTKEVSPQWWVRKMLKNIPADPAEPFFLVREGEHRYPLTSSQIRRLMKQWCIGSALDPRSYTLQGMRRGGLNWAHQAKLSGESLKYLGDWTTQCYHRYLEFDFKSRVKSTQQMVKHANEYN